MGSFAVKPDTLAQVTGVLDRVGRWSGIAVAWLILPMVLSLVWEVTARYVFDAPTTWAYDMTFMLYGTFFMVGSAWTLQRGGHIRTDTYYARWTPRTRARVDVACYLVLFFPALAILAWLGAEYFWKSFEQNERIVTSPWLPIVWPFKFMISFASVLLLVQGISELLKAWARAFGPAGAAPPDAAPAQAEGEVSL